MARIPEPTHTPAGPTYEGRLLDRPDDEVVDQGASFDITTLVTRRRVLSLFGAGVGAFALAACSNTSGAADPTSSSTTAAVATGEIPDETNGPPIPPTARMESTSWRNRGSFAATSPRASAEAPPSPASH